MIQLILIFYFTFEYLCSTIFAYLNYSKSKANRVQKKNERKGLNLIQINFNCT